MLVLFPLLVQPNIKCVHSFEDIKIPQNKKKICKVNNIHKIRDEERYHESKPYRAVKKRLKKVEEIQVGREYILIISKDITLSEEEVAISWLHTKFSVIKTLTEN